MTFRRYVFAAFTALALTAVDARAQDAPPCAAQSFESSTFTVCRSDPQKQDIPLADADSSGKALRSFDALARFLGPDARVDFAMNAGMFDHDGLPIGLYVEDGVVRHGLNTAAGAGNFYMQPNGVFSIAGDGKAAIETTSAFAQRQDTPQWATQSGPMLVIGGAVNPQISHDGPSHYLRNAVGITTDGTVVFVISDDRVSFGKLARFMSDTLACRDALYFDGDISSLWQPSAGRKDVKALLGPMIVVTDRR